MCYATRVSRWIGMLTVSSDVFEDHSPIYAPENDPFSIRFKVEPTVWLPIEHGVPIHDDRLWERLSFTRGLAKNSTAWTGKVRSSLADLQEEDARLIIDLIRQQDETGESHFPLSDDDRKKLKIPTVRTATAAVVPVSIPSGDPPEEVHRPSRESTRFQALLADIGERMGFQIWLPRNDRSRVCDVWKPRADSVLVDQLPLNYEETTLGTIEQIDVLWLRRRTIVRAFEVEHTTAVYSGILRMADLLALQPNLEIKSHIVAPDDRREKVFQEITRPVFALLEGGPLADVCTYIAYGSLEELAREKHLEHMSESILDDYCEEAES